MAFPWSSDRRSQSTGIWFYIDCHYHTLRMLTPSYIGSELTRKGVCEQAEHVMSPQEYMRVEYDVTMKTRTNQPMLKYRCSYKAFLQKRKLWVFFTIWRQRSVPLWFIIGEFCVPVVHISYLEVAIFIFSFHSKSMSVYMRMSTYRTECTYCLVYFYAAFSRVLRN